MKNKKREKGMQRWDISYSNS